MEGDRSPGPEAEDDDPSAAAPGALRPPLRAALARNEQFDRMDRFLTGWMAEWGIPLLRVSLGVTFLWFGALKFFPGASPAERLAGDTIEVMTLGLLDPRLALTILAAWECLIGLGLVTGRFLRATLFLLFVQMPGTVMPLFFFPELTFQRIPFVLTIEGQYIVKNVVLVSAAFVVGATVRGGRLVGERTGAAAGS
ncbi:MAG: DoxX family protein [Longimicrobiales bacterium]